MSEKKESPLVNKGTVSGVATILSGIVQLLSVFGVLPATLVLPVVGAINTIAGAITTKDSVDIRTEKQEAE